MEIIITLMFFIILGLCWGSFLNVVAYRITFDKPFFTRRSHCPSCDNIIAFYDNIPLISWVYLKQRCRNCSATISWIYPCIEAATSFLITMLAIQTFDVTNIAIIKTIDLCIFFSYFIFFSALIVATATDLHAMVIPQLVTLWLVPVGVGLTFFGWTNISFIDSIVGTIIGYGILWTIAWFFKKTTNQDGIGEGDMELLAMIGSFLGIKGIWFALMCGSITGFLVGSVYLIIIGKNKKTPIPFGPFLSIGALIFFFFEPYLSSFLLGGY